jgi:hypothetical protein
VGRRDRDDDGLASDSNLKEDGIQLAKSQIVKLSFETPDFIHRILSDICEMIARDRFDLNWHSFVPDLVCGLKLNDPIITMRVFEMFSPVVKKIRFSCRSDDLYSQINYIFKEFFPILTEYTGVSDFYPKSNLLQK